MEQRNASPSTSSGAGLLKVPDLLADVMDHLGPLALFGGPYCCDQLQNRGLLCDDQKSVRSWEEL